MIYENHLKKRQHTKNSVLAADAAMQVANIMEEQNRLNDAFHYVNVAVDTYREVYSESSDNTILATWLKL